MSEGKGEAHLASPSKSPRELHEEGTPQAPAPPASALATSMLGGSSTAGDASLSPPATYGDPPGRMLCQVADCDVDLRHTKPYCIKKRLCPDHLTAQAVKRRGANHGWWRFCQQCGKLEPLEAFDGGKRSCRARLQKRRAHNTAKTHDSLSYICYYPNQKQRGSSGSGGNGDQKRQKAEGNKKVQRSGGEDGHEHDGSEGLDEGEYMDEDFLMNGAAEVAANMEVYSTLAGQSAAAAAAASGIGLDPAAAAAVVGYRGLGALAAAVGAGDYHQQQEEQQQLRHATHQHGTQQQQQQAALLQNILLANSMASAAAAAAGNDAVPPPPLSQAPSMQNTYAAAMMAAAAAAAQPEAGLQHLPARAAAGAWAEAGDTAAWGEGAQHSSGIVVPAASAGMPAASTQTAALAAVRAALAGQQQQALQGSVADLQHWHQQNSTQQLDSLTGMRHEDSIIMHDRSTGHLPNMPYQDGIHQQQHLSTLVKQELPQEMQDAAAAITAAAGAGDAAFAARHAHLVGMLGHVLDKMGPNADAEPGAAAAAVLAAAASAGLASLSGDSAATAAAGAGTATVAGAGYFDRDMSGTGGNTPSPESAADAITDPAATAAAAPVTVNKGARARSPAAPSATVPLAAAAATLAASEAAAAAAAAGATAPSASSLAELGKLLQLGAGLCNTLGTAGTSTASPLSQEVSTRLLTTIFAQAPAAAATLMLAQQQQLQQLMLQQQQLMKMVMQQQEQLQQQMQEQSQKQTQDQLRKQKRLQQQHQTAAAQQQKQQHQQQQTKQQVQQQQQQHQQHAQQQSKPAARSSDPFDALLAAAAVVDGEDHDQGKRAGAEPAQPRTASQAQHHPKIDSHNHLYNNGSSHLAHEAQQQASGVIGQDVVEVVSAQLQTMAKQIAAALAPIQSQMGEFQAELHRMKTSDERQQD